MLFRSTDQIDVENGKRYDISYIDENNTEKNPIILHNSPSGAIERIIYALLEKAAKDSQEGKKPQLPLWLAPTQVRVIPIKENFNDHCISLQKKISSENVRVDIDDRNESIGKRIRDAEKEWIQYILVIGDKEVNSTNLSIRDRQTGSMRELSFDDFIKEIHTQTQNKPFTSLNQSTFLSKRPNLMV